MSETATTIPQADRPLVSVFVYAYCQEHLVRAAIESAFAQTYQPLEILLSDNASTDGTFRIMQEMAAAYRGPHKVILNRNEENLGMCGHVDRCVELTRGEFLVQFCGDDISLPERVERSVAAWLASGRRAKLVHTAKYRMREDGRPLGRLIESNVLAGKTPYELIANTCKKRPKLNGASAAFSREIYEVFGPLAPVSVIDDYPMCFRASLIGEVHYIDEPLVYYRENGATNGWRHERISGENFLYGFPLKQKRWELSFQHSYLRDMERVPPPDYLECRAMAERTVRELEFTIAMAEASHAGRLAALPQAGFLSLRHGDSGFLETTLKYLFDKPYMRYIDWRLAQAAAGPPVTTAEQPH